MWADSGTKYQCFVEGCDKVCSTPQKRRMHLTDKHVFPKVSTSPELAIPLVTQANVGQNYDFQIVNTGIDKRSSMLRARPRKDSSAASRAFQHEQRKNSTEASPNHGLEPRNTLESPAAQNSNGSDGTSSHSPSLHADVDELTSTMSALKFVPPSVHFGRGGRRGGLSRSWSGCVLSAQSILCHVKVWKLPMRWLGRYTALFDRFRTGALPSSLSSLSTPVIHQLSLSNQRVLKWAYLSFQLQRKAPHARHRAS